MRVACHPCAQATTVNGPDSAGKFPWLGVILICPVAVRSRVFAGHRKAPAPMGNDACNSLGGVAKLSVENSIFTSTRPGLTYSLVQVMLRAAARLTTSPAAGAVRQGP